MKVHESIFSSFMIFFFLSRTYLSALSSPHLIHFHFFIITSSHYDAVYDIWNLSIYIFIFKCHRYVCRDVNEGIFYMFKGETTPKITLKWKLKIKTIDCAWETFLGVNFQNTSIAYSSKVKRRQIRYENLCQIWQKTPTLHSCGKQFSYYGKKIWRMSERGMGMRKWKYFDVDIVKKD